MTLTALTAPFASLSAFASPGAAAAALGLGLLLSVSCGLRAFLAPFALSVCGYMGWLDLGPTFAWMSSGLAVATFSLAILVELVADKIPAVDHLFDSAHVFLKPALATLAGAALLQGPSGNPLLACVLGLCTSGAVAGITHVTKASVRVGSSATTVGAANPVLSIIEDGVAIGLTAALAWGATQFA